MGKRSRSAMAADLAVTVMGVGGFLGFLVAARMDEREHFAFRCHDLHLVLRVSRAETVFAVVQIEAHRLEAEAIQ
jgi:hypothetical protein